MAELGKFIAFQAAIALLKEHQHFDVIERTYDACIAELRKPTRRAAERVRDIYAPFTDEQISAEGGGTGHPGRRQLEGRGARDLSEHRKSPPRASATNAGTGISAATIPRPAAMPSPIDAFVRYHDGRSGRPYDFFD